MIFIFVYFDGVIFEHGYKFCVYFSNDHVIRVFSFLYSMNGVRFLINSYTHIPSHNSHTPLIEHLTNPTNTLVESFPTCIPGTACDPRGNLVRPALEPK